MITVPWAGHYIGLPFKEHGRDRSGLDCWGLARLVYSEQFGLDLPSYATDYSSTLAVKEINGIVVHERSRSWQPIPPGQEQPGDIVLFRVRGADCHVGIVIGARRFLHVSRGIDSTHEEYNSLRWGRRFSGFWRFA